MSFQSPFFRLRYFPGSQDMSQLRTTYPRCTPRIYLPTYTIPHDSNADFGRTIRTIHASILQLRLFHDYRASSPPIPVAPQSPDDTGASTIFATSLRTLPASRGREQLFKWRVSLPRYLCVSWVE